MEDEKNKNKNNSQAPQEIPSEGSVGGYDRDRRSAAPVTTGGGDSVSERCHSDIFIDSLDLPQSVFSNLVLQNPTKALHQYLPESYDR